MSGRLPVNKTYKLYIGGQFPRTESGRYYEVTSEDKFVGNICQASRKDFRSAVETARGAFGGWAGRSAYNRGQILYRIAEMLEGRKAQFVEELQWQNETKKDAEHEVSAAIDLLIAYAGWADKYQQVFSSVNPVASSHFDFSTPVPTGVIAAVAPEDTSLFGLVSVVAPAVVGGNTIIVLASEKKPLCACTFAEVLQTSDVPGGVVNILTGNCEELLPHMAGHMDVNALIYTRNKKDDIVTAQKGAATNLKRVLIRDKDAGKVSAEASPYLLMQTQEVQTTWHPIGV